MEKEEIEEIKRLLFQGRLSQYGKRKLVQYLEQKENTLDKVTDKLKEDIDFLEFCRDKDMDSGYGEDEEDRAVRVYIESILNIIEGEKK